MLDHPALDLLFLVNSSSQRDCVEKKHLFDCKRLLGQSATEPTDGPTAKGRSQQKVLSPHWLRTSRCTSTAAQRRRAQQSGSCGRWFGPTWGPCGRDTAKRAHGQMTETLSGSHESKPNISRIMMLTRLRKHNILFTLPFRLCRLLM